ncbi:Uncharacterised protein [Yersinia frederiksenii]|nr:Uncharacterised protein [Yersinia frederiksenii]
MEWVIIYLFCGIPLGAFELISVLLIRDGGLIRLKLIYGLIVVILWPLIFIVTFIPEKVLKKLRKKP